jgi:hypothetical protein
LSRKRRMPAFTRLSSVGGIRPQWCRNRQSCRAKASSARSGEPGTP